MRIGIDPGNTGAIALLRYNGELIAVHDMPLVTEGKKQKVNAPALAKLLDPAPFTGDTTHVYLERVSAMPGQGVTSMFNFGMGYGVIQGVLAALRLPYTLVTPQAWKKRAGLVGKDKDMSRTRAIELYPEAPLSRKKDIGRADAILIARYGETK